MPTCFLRLAISFFCSIIEMRCMKPRYSFVIIIVVFSVGCSFTMQEKSSWWKSPRLKNMEDVELLIRFIQLPKFTIRLYWKFNYWRQCQFSLLKILILSTLKFWIKRDFRTSVFRNVNASKLATWDSPKLIWVRELNLIVAMLYKIFDELK